MNKLSHLFAILLTLSLSACCCMTGTPKKQPAQAVALRSDARQAKDVDVTLYTLNPYRSFWGQPREAKVYHGFGVVGEAAITNTVDKQMVLDALATGIEHSKDSAQVCFKPRHGLHVVSNGQATDYVICFQCLRMRVYRNDTLQNVLISNSPAHVYVSAVKKLNIPPPPQ